MRSASGTGRGRKYMPSSRLKTTAFTPMPSARHAMAAAAYPRIAANDAHAIMQIAPQIREARAGRATTAPARTSAPVPNTRDGRRRVPCSFHADPRRWPSPRVPAGACSIRSASRGGSLCMTGPLHLDTLPHPVEHVLPSEPRRGREHLEMPFRTAAALGSRSPNHEWR